MTKRKLRLWIIILGFILISSIFHLPSKGISLLARYFLKHKYGLSVKWTGFKGGFVNGITLEGVKVSDKDYTFLECLQISSNVRFKDFIFPQSHFPYYVFIEEPKLSIRISSFQTDMPKTIEKEGMPLGIKAQILVSGADLLMQDSGRLVSLELDNLSGNVNKNRESIAIFLMAPDHLTALTGDIDLSECKGTLEIGNGKIKLPYTDLPPVEINGSITLDTERIKIEKWIVSLGELDLEAGGSIFADGKLDLEISSGVRDPRFLVRGSLDEPLIFTNWGVIETVYQIEGARYSNGKLIFPRVIGEIQLPGFIPFELEGELILGPGDIGFEDVTLAKVVNIDGVISRHRESKLRLWVEDTKGSTLAARLPEVLRPFISSHTVSARLSVYGGIDNLQSGGILKLTSYPIEIACRYRHNRFSFRSIRDEPFGISGSINLGGEPNMKIKGYFHNMDFVELMSLFSEDVDPSCKGIVDGEFRISGKLNDPEIKAKLEIKEGQIGSIKFDVAYLNLERTGPILNLAHSMVYYKEIPAELTGYIDLKEKDLFSNINIIPTSDSFIWKGLNVIKDAKEKTVIFGQDVDENISVHIKTPLSSDPENGGMDSEPEVKVEYKLREDKSILIKMEEDEGTIGIKHKIEF